MTNTKTPLARLEPVEVRRVWPNETQDFTPWLAEDENLQLLGETLGMKLESAGTEVSVGSFSADILAIDTNSRSKVLIENQLAPTDHSHLGQVLTYAAGLDAPTVVWIARRFTDEHRAALEWLNNATTADFRFFGLEVEVWKIGNSAHAPKFNIVAKPNDWTKSVGPSATRTPTQQAQLGFWRGFHAYVLDHSSRLRPTKPQPWAYMTFAIGRNDFGLTAVANSWSEQTEAPELRAEFVVGGAQAKAHFATLHADREAIHSEFGAELEWYSSTDALQCRIFLRRDIDWQESERHEECHAWLLAKLDRLDRIFRARVSRLP